MAKATVYNPQTGQRKVVTVGDPKAFEGGFQLEKKSPLDKTLSGTRSLPDDDSQLTNMQSVMRMLKIESDKAQPSPLFKLQNFESITGIKPITTGAITGVIEMGEKERFADIAERSKTLVDRLTTQEAKREVYQAENRKWFKDTLDDMDAESVSKLTGEDFENGLMGILTPELTRKIATAKARTVELGKKKVGGRKIVPDTEEALGKPDFSFEEFIQKKSEALRMSIAFPEKFRSEYDQIVNDIDKQMQGREIRGKAQSFSFLNEVVKNNSQATWEELYILARTRMPDLSIVDIETYLRSKGFSKTKATKTKASEGAELFK